MKPAIPVAPVPVRAEAQVLSNADDGGGNRRLKLALPEWPGAQPGQFVMISPGAQSQVWRTDPLLPRPMAVYRSTDAGAAAGELEVLYKVVGRGTALLAEAGAGQRLRVVGPLGVGFAVPERDDAAILVGGGTGIASLYELARVASASCSVPPRVLLGGRRETDLMGRQDFAGLDVDLRLATEDGRGGHRGLVTALLESALKEAVGTVHACGPTPMMRRCAEIAEAHGAACRVSLENGMACGFGVCLGCAVPCADRAGFALVCRDGPVFDSQAVRWEGLP